MRHPTEEELIILFYGESDDAAGIREHLKECRICQEEYQSLQAVFQAVSSLPVPERPAQYGGDVWRRLQPALDEIDSASNFSPSDYRVAPVDIRRGRMRRYHVPDWLTAGAMAALLLLAFLTGKYWPTNHSQPVATTEQARERALMFTVGEHLERSERILTEVANIDGASPVNIATEQRWAEELLSSNRLYRMSSARAGEAALAGVLEELERALLEIAHSSATLSQPELERLRRRIDDQGILFKIRIMNSEIKQKERLAARKANQQTS